MPGQQSIQAASPDPKIKPGQQRTNHSRFRASVINEGKAVHAQDFGEPIERMLASKQYGQVQNGGCYVAQAYSADDFSLH
ncbi:MAG: hypothetical protein JO151_05825, partial [Verrucomicrobia bacterium]|nr:hypothetical protein [Verrucomicrobiota bacterium]